ncbi:glycosyltransferase [Psychrobacter sp. ANT_WB68]|uniref:glycosyltransferase n=1 Tax=Psychrobacter sp. ANT_WB68 TaxID=2597355 RepID=UPI0011F0A7B9|nr:glycosyltransferase [Psychrobacter sp. ANT_WB68]KAA0914486.1 glycosyltransferase family 4 protein [Psychrobacter sp. ANT_WB68]
MSFSGSISYANSVELTDTINPSHKPSIETSDRPLRIAILAHCLYPIAQPYAGGLEMITQLICDELFAQGHEVLLYAHTDSCIHATLVPLLTREEFDATVYINEHVSVGMSREEMYQYLVYQDAMRDIIERDERGEIDIVHNHSLHHIPMMTGQAFGARFFTTFHTPIFPQLRLALLTLRHGTQTQFTAISKHQQQLFSEFVPSQVVYNGIDVESFDANTDCTDNLTCEHGEVYFWYGRICPEKGTHLAMQYCMEAGKKLIIAGPKSNEAYFDEQVAPLLAKDNENGAQKLFDYVGHVTKDEVNRYLCKATAMLFTSTWDEPYGLTLAESLACGTPVIGFDVGASAEIVTPSTGIIVAKEDKDAFIKGFANIKNISRQACRERALNFCSVAAMVEGYLALYKMVLYKTAVAANHQEKSFDNQKDGHLAMNSFNLNNDKSKPSIASVRGLNNSLDSGSNSTLNNKAVTINLGEQG